MIGPIYQTRALGRSAHFLALALALVSPVFVHAQGRPRAVDAPRIERRSTEEHRRDPSEGRSTPDRDVRIKELSPGWVVEEKQSTRRFGGDYSRSLRETAESRFRRLIDTPIDIKGLRLISMIDNSQTTDAVQASPLLRSLAVAGASLTRDEVLATIRQSSGKVVLFLAHIRDDGSIETKDQLIPIRELADVASSSNVPFLAMGCRSANFVSSGYTTEINSVDVVTKLAKTLGTAETFGNVLGSLTTRNDDIQLDWQFLAGATEVLRIKLFDKKGDERGAIYVGGIRAWYSTPSPQPTRLAYLAVKTGLPYWIWRGLIFSCLLVITVCLFELANVGLGSEILRISSGCLFVLCFIGSLLAIAVIITGLGLAASGPFESFFFVAAMVLVYLCFNEGGKVFDHPRNMPAFVIKGRVPLGTLGLTVLGLTISAIVG
jgi:hypothetical protein